MTLPASGVISMSDVNVELGLSSTATISLNDTAVRTLAGVASGAISLDSLHGKSNYAASLPTTMTGGEFAISTADASATLAVNAAGGWTLTGGGSGTWLTGGGSGSNYDVRLSQTSSSGNAIGGTLATWLNLASNRTWTLVENRNGFYSSEFIGTLEIRLAASPFTVLDSSTVTINCDVEV